VKGRTRNAMEIGGISEAKTEATEKTPKYLNKINALCIF
jgi:hypothetical protein